MPHRSMISALSASSPVGSGLFGRAGHPDPHLVAPGGDVHPAGRAGSQRARQPAQRLIQAGFESLDEFGGILWLTDGLVVHIALQVEIRGQVRLRVAPAARAEHPDLPAPDRVAQRAQGAQLVRAALDASPLINHRILPRQGYHAIQRDRLGRVIVLRPTVAVGVAAQQLDRVHHRSVAAVVAPKLQRGQQIRQQPPVVVGVGARQHGTHPRPTRGLGGLVLGHHVAQALLSARGREHHLPHRSLGVIQAGFGDPGQHRVFVLDPAKLSEQLAFHPLLGAGVDPVHQRAPAACRRCR